MTVLVTLSVPADGAKLLDFFAKADPDAVGAIVIRAKSHGVISHRFFASEDEVLILDEWPHEASFQAFFAASPEIQDVMAAADASGLPAGHQ